jgi:Domain of unknown function (DUF4386)
MTVVVLARLGETKVNERSAENAQRAYARLAGLMYFLVLGFDVAGLLIVSSVGGGGSFLETSHRIMASETLYRIGLCCSLVGSLSTILLATGLYVAVKPADGNLALMALLFRVTEAATGAIGLTMAFIVLQIHLVANHANAFDPNQLGALAGLSSGVGTAISAIFFTLGSTIFFYVFLKSNYIPRILSAWGIFASLVYTTVWFVSLILPQYSATATTYGSLPILVAELSTGLWLLLLGIKVQPRSERASARSR